MQKSKSPGERRKTQDHSPRGEKKEKRVDGERGKEAEVGGFSSCPEEELESETLRRIFRVSLWNVQGCTPLAPLRRKLWLKKNRHYFSKLSECICSFLLRPSSVRFAYSQKVLMELQDNLRKGG